MSVNRREFLRIWGISATALGLEPLLTACRRKVQPPDWESVGPESAINLEHFEFSNRLNDFSVEIHEGVLEMLTSVYQVPLEETPQSLEISLLPTSQLAKNADGSPRVSQITHDESEKWTIQLAGKSLTNLARSMSGFSAHDVRNEPLISFLLSYFTLESLTDLALQKKRMTPELAEFTKSDYWEGLRVDRRLQFARMQSTHPIRPTPLPPTPAFPDFENDIPSA